jgi:hypothetical protein
MRPSRNILIGLCLIPLNALKWGTFHRRSLGVLIILVAAQKLAYVHRPSLG